MQKYQILCLDLRKEKSYLKTSYRYWKFAIKEYMTSLEYRFHFSFYSNFDKKENWITNFLTFFSEINLEIEIISVTDKVTDIFTSDIIYSPIPDIRFYDEFWIFEILNTHYLKYIECYFTLKYSNSLYGQSYVKYSKKFI